MKNTSVVKFGVAALAMGAVFASTLPVKADTPDLSNPFTKHGLPVPGAYFKNQENQKPATIAVSKEGQGVGEKKPTTSKASKKATQHVRSAKKDS
jgi:hypothetical protein